MCIFVSVGTGIPSLGSPLCPADDSLISVHFNALTLLTGKQEWHQADKKICSSATWHTLELLWKGKPAKHKLKVGVA